MTRNRRNVMPFIVGLAAMLFVATGYAQEETTLEKTADSEGVTEKAKAALDETTQTIEDTAKQVDQSEQAQEISAGVLQPIYLVAEQLAFPAFHWVAFTLMATGLVSFLLQLVLGKLVLLSKMSFSLSELLADVLGFLVSLIGLVLTTQAAAENSTFTTSPAAVLSASAIGLIAGFIFYRWGQAQELAAAQGRRTQKK